MHEQYRVKPSMSRSLNKGLNDHKEKRAEALSIIRRAEAKRGSLDNVASRDTNRSNLPKIGQSKFISVSELP